MKLNLILMREAAGEEEYAAGREIEENGGVRIAEQDPHLIRYAVAGTPVRNVTLSREMTVRCDCPLFEKRGVCRHVIAAALRADRDKIPENLLKMNAPACAEELSSLILREMPGEPNVRLEITLVLPARPGQGVHAGLRIGEKKLYVVRDPEQFLFADEKKEKISFGRGFVYEPEWMRFSTDDSRALNLFRKLISIRAEEEKPAKETGSRLIRVPDAFILELLEEIGETPLRIMDPTGKIISCDRIRTERLDLRFEIHLTPRGLNVSARLPEAFRPVTGDCTWCLCGEKLIRADKTQQQLIHLIWNSQYEGKCLFEYPLRETDRVIGEILPYLKLRGTVEMSADLNRRLVRMPLRTEVYLDRDGRSITATVQFRYGPVSLNPFTAVADKITLDKGEKLLLRDAEGEHRVLEILANTGFRVRKEHIRLSGSDAIFQFVSEGVRKLQEISDVFPSREFKRMLPRRPVLSGRMKMNGDRLELILSRDGEEPAEDILELIEALSRRHRYFRLKSGEFLDLSGMEEWQEISDAILEAARRDGNGLNRDIISLRAYRAGYLTSMLAESNIRIDLDDSVRETAERLAGKQEPVKAPALAPGLALREYQHRGYEWMYTLDRMKMGGILADDMGLGKTVQVIALLQATHEQHRTSLVIAPTSLTYNWLSEIRRFAPDLSTVLISGNSTQRAGLIRHVTQNSDVDIVITSYPLIRRDIDLLKDYCFRFVILDEAQNIKNAGSVAASAVKQLKGDTRFALTGTPMENGVGELWSLFDFVLPGYLPGYNTFIRKYQEGENAEDLLRRIRPFLTRRLKQDVLTELPDKMEITLTARMTPDQEKVYRAAMERLRPKVNGILDGRGNQRGKIEVLSALTELRQICCHPSLVMNEYRGGSGKEDLLMDILPEMIGSGRRILIFSQFTTMLRLLEKKLNGEGYLTMYMDGETPADDRLRLTEEYNQGAAEIFLISLKAGGYGLNLTGADLVIHYDPWWNPATEDQATDRVYRIGQQKKVQVIRLITGESIEEQVTELGSRKKALFERLITPGESALNALSESEIRNLFR